MSNQFLLISIIYSVSFSLYASCTDIADECYYECEDSGDRSFCEKECDDDFDYCLSNRQSSYPGGSLMKQFNDMVIKESNSSKKNLKLYQQKQEAERQRQYEAQQRAYNQQNRATQKRQGSNQYSVQCDYETHCHTGPAGAECRAKKAARGC